MATAIEILLGFCAIGLALYAVHLCVISMHEAGHAIAAQALGLRWSRITVGTFYFDRETGFAFQVHWVRLLDGSVQMQFRTMEQSKKAIRAFGAIFAGPLFSLGFCALAGTFAPSRGISSELVNFALVDSCLVGVVLTLIPQRVRLRESDGYKLWSILFSPKRRQRLMFALSIRARIDELKELSKTKDFPKLLRVTNELIQHTADSPELRAQPKWMEILLKIRAWALQGTGDSATEQPASVETE